MFFIVPRDVGEVFTPRVELDFIKDSIFNMGEHLRDDFKVIRLNRLIGN